MVLPPCPKSLSLRLGLYFAASTSTPVTVRVLKEKNIETITKSLLLYDCIFLCVFIDTYNWCSPNKLYAISCVAFRPVGGSIVFDTSVLYYHHLLFLLTAHITFFCWFLSFVIF